MIAVQSSIMPIPNQPRVHREPEPVYLCERCVLCGMFLFQNHPAPLQHELTMPPISSSAKCGNCGCASATSVTIAISPSSIMQRGDAEHARRSTSIFTPAACEKPSASTRSASPRKRCASCSGSRPVDRIGGASATSCNSFDGDQHAHRRARLLVAPAVLAGRIQHHLVMRMLDRRDAQSPAAQFAQQLLDQRGLAGAGMADEDEYRWAS